MSKFNYVIFVYGTLKKNQRANKLLVADAYLGEAITKPNYKLYSCGFYPALVEANEHGYEVCGELYGITENTKQRLDIYEGAVEGYYSFLPVRLQKISLISFEKTISEENIYAYFFNGSTANLEMIKKWPCTDDNLVYNLD